jgi:hypothetical protein
VVNSRELLDRGKRERERHPKDILICIG